MSRSKAKKHFTALSATVNVTRQNYSVTINMEHALNNPRLCRSRDGKPRATGAFSGLVHLRRYLNTLKTVLGNSNGSSGFWLSLTKRMSFEPQSPNPNLCGCGGARCGPTAWPGALPHPTCEARAHLAARPPTCLAPVGV